MDIKLMYTGPLYCIDRKFDGELNLVDWHIYTCTAKFYSTNNFWHVVGGVYF